MGKKKDSKRIFVNMKVKRKCYTVYSHMMFELKRRNFDNHNNFRLRNYHIYKYDSNIKSL